MEIDLKLVEIMRGKFGWASRNNQRRNMFKWLRNWITKDERKDRHEWQSVHQKWVGDTISSLIQEKDLIKRLLPFELEANRVEWGPYDKRDEKRKELIKNGFNLFHVYPHGDELWIKKK